MRVRNPPTPKLSESKFLSIAAHAEHRNRKTTAKSCEPEKLFCFLSMFLLFYDICTHLLTESTIFLRVCQHSVCLFKKKRLGERYPAEFSVDEKRPFFRYNWHKIYWITDQERYHPRNTFIKCCSSRIFQAQCS